MRSSFGALLLLSLAAACGSPPLDEYQAHAGIVRGTVVYPAGTARGNVLIFLFAADDPPPPEGTGRPVNFVVVPQSTFFGDIAEGQPADFAAPFTIPQVAAGAYTIRAFIDARGQFNPIYEELDEPMAGDVAGGYVDASGTFLPVNVRTDQVSDHVLVTLGLVIPTERPVFALEGTPSFPAPLTAPVQIKLAAHAIVGDHLKMDPRRTVFVVRYADAARQHLFPQVVLRLIQKDATAAPVILPCALDTSPYLPTLNRTGTATTTELIVNVAPLAVRLNGTAQTPLPATPAGEYATIVVEGTGQTWTVPNALSRIEPSLADSTQQTAVQLR